MRTGDGIDALARVDRNGNSVTESQFAILRAAACQPDTEALLPLPGTPSARANVGQK